MTHAEQVAQHARRLLTRRDVLSRQLAAIDLQLEQARRSYSDAKGYRVPLRVETFRLEVRP